MSLVRLGLTLLLALSGAAAIGASSEAGPENEAVVGQANGGAGVSVVNGKVDDALSRSREGNEDLHDETMLVRVAHHPGIVPAVEVRSSEPADEAEQARQSEPESRESDGEPIRASEGDTSSSVPEVLVALIFAVFGLLLVTRRKHSHEG